ncbi:MAG: hypothetical protein KDB07_11110, partial [Planctomycetes bacterium]|nr:hypothetical protein [Planctomycetota bacterium]
MSTKVPVELVRRAAQDRSAMEELITQFKGFVLSLARPRCLDAASAEDICQEVWLIVERELASLREP